MRSLGFTLLLALFALLASGLATWQWIEGHFNSVLGAPPVPLGQTIYSGFSPSEVKRIQISTNGNSTSFELSEKGWYAKQPWSDRMDPRAAVSIIQFTLSMRVEDFAPRDDIDAQKAGLADSGVDILLEGENRQPLARYKLGRQTPWLATIKDIPESVPTVFIHPRDEGRKRYIYAATGDILPLFKDSLKFLRDHRPFYINPVALQKIRIQADEGELTLGRENPKSPWRIVKPLDLPTDPKAIKSLLEGLYELQAIKIIDRANATLSTGNQSSKSKKIALSSFGSETETILDITPTESPEARDAIASISDRPNTLFVIPLKPEPNLISLADLPLSINDLRDPTLTNLNIQSLRGILIQPATGADILISRNPPQPWTVTIEDQSYEANEERLFTLLKTVTESRAIGFETDAATDFSPWGLDRPFLRLRFLGQNNQGLELAFGIDNQGRFFVNRLGSPTVMRVDSSLIASISIHPYEWKPARLWSLDRLNLMRIDRTKQSSPTLELRYDFISEEWKANQDDKNLTASINPSRANFMLSMLEGLKVTRWLSSQDEAANQALLTPSLTFRVFEKQTDPMGDFTGISNRYLNLAPAVLNAESGFYYGRLGQDPNPFLLDRDSYQKLATELFSHD